MNSSVLFEKASENGKIHHRMRGGKKKEETTSGVGVDDEAVRKYTEQAKFNQIRDSSLLNPPG